MSQGIKYGQKNKLKKYWLKNNRNNKRKTECK